MAETKKNPPATSTIAGPEGVSGKQVRQGQPDPATGQGKDETQHQLRR